MTYQKPQGTDFETHGENIDGFGTQDIYLAQPSTQGPKYTN